MSRFRLSDRAEADLRSIWKFIGLERDKPHAADNLVDRLYGKFALLASQPLMGQLRDDFRPGLRTFAAESYVILYYPMIDGIEVVGVVHSARDIDEFSRREDR